MPLDPQLRATLRQIVGYATAATVDYAGQIQPGSVSTCFARVEPRFREVPMGTTIEERTNHMIIMDWDVPLREGNGRDAFFWLPGDPLGDMSFARRAKVFHTCYDELGRVDHLETIV